MHYDTWKNIENVDWNVVSEASEVNVFGACHVLRIIIKMTLMKAETTFGELKIGQAFHFRGVRYVKRALACAEDARNWGHVFLAETVVERDGEGGANAEILNAESTDT